MATEAGFVQGQSDNLPKIDVLSMFAFLGNNPNFMGAELKGVKAVRSARESYGDNAVGWVQVKRDGDICIVKARVTPEHSVRKKTYAVKLECNEKDETILSVQCEDCAASLDFSKNPQYLLSINGPQKNKEYRILIGLMQKDRRIHNLPQLPLGFVIYRLPDSTTGGGRLTSNFLAGIKPIYARKLEAAKQITSHVDFLNGSYCIIPFTVDKKSNCDFLLRVYSEVPFNVVENDEGVGIISNKNGSKINPSPAQSADSAIKEVFNSISGGDDQITWKELKLILDLLLKSEKKEFPKEMCRSMLAMMDTDRSGKLNFHEFFQLWEMIGLWRGTFRNFDKDRSGTISGPELREAFKGAEIRVNNRILNMLMLRYGNENGEMEIDDFLHCCIKLTTMIQIYEANYSKIGKLENWIIDTVYT